MTSVASCPESRAVAIRYNARTYVAHQTPGGIIVRVGFKMAVCHDERTAYLWLGNNGLRRGRIKNLLAAALRGEGAYVENPDHPNLVRLKDSSTTPAPSPAPCQ